MSNFVLHTSQTPTTSATNNAFFFNSSILSPRQVLPQNVGEPKILRSAALIKCSSETTSSATTEEGKGIPKVTLERCFIAPSVPPASCSANPDPNMKGGKKRSPLSVQLAVEKGKLDVTSKKNGPVLDLEGGGGDIGKKIFLGGGDGGDDGGDDDDYHDEFDDDDEGEEGGFFRKKKLFKEVFDRKFVDSVLDEWQKTMMDLPSGLRQAYEMGLISSAQMVTILATNARPTIARTISRYFPSSISREFIGRMLADPAFLYKILLEQAATVGITLWMEVSNRKERMKKEWDLALLNVLTVTACNAFVVWSLAPCRSYGNTFRFDLQNTLQKLPNNIFERSYPLREFDLYKRIHSFFFKAAELSLVGMAAGAVQGSLSKALSNVKTERVSITVPSLSTSILGYGAFLGLYANVRYQLLCGVDQAMVRHFDVIGVALCFTTALRMLNCCVGESSKLAWLGMETDPMAEMGVNVKEYKHLGTESKWFISKELISGLEFLGIKQNQNDVGDQSSTSKARRKRVVRKRLEE